MTVGVDEAATVAGDVVSMGLVIGTLAQWLPSVAAVLSIVWTVIRIVETKTVQGWLGRTVE